MNTIEQAFKYYDSKELGRCVSRGMRLKAERGIMPGYAPLGYRNAIVNGERVIIPTPETAPKVKQLFELAQTEKMSLRQLAAEVATRQEDRPDGAESRIAKLILLWAAKIPRRDLHGLI